MIVMKRDGREDQYTNMPCGITSGILYKNKDTYGDL